jgi:hypothetical protein
MQFSLNYASKEIILQDIMRREHALPTTKTSSRLEIAGINTSVRHNHVPFYLQCINYELLNDFAGGPLYAKHSSSIVKLLGLTAHRFHLVID